MCNEWQQAQRDPGDLVDATETRLELGKLEIEVTRHGVESNRKKNRVILHF